MEKLENKIFLMKQGHYLCACIFNIAKNACHSHNRVYPQNTFKILIKKAL